MVPEAVEVWMGPEAAEAVGLLLLKHLMQCLRPQAWKIEAAGVLEAEAAEGEGVEGSREVEAAWFKCSRLDSLNFLSGDSRL